LFVLISVTWQDARQTMCV